MNNTKQLFATHSLADLANIAAKLRYALNDAAKKEAMLGTMLADGYPTLLASCQRVASIKDAAHELSAAVDGLRNWAPQGATAAAETARAANGPVVRSALAVLDEAWSSLCTNQYGAAIRQLEAAAQSPSKNPLHAMTLSSTRTLLGHEFTAHMARAAAAPSPSLVAEYAAVQAHVGSDLAPSYLAEQRAQVLGVLDTHLGDDTAETAVSRALGAVRVATQLAIPPALLAQWTTDVQTALAAWMRQHNVVFPADALERHLRATDASPKTADAWRGWLADVQFALHQDTVDALLTALRDQSAGVVAGVEGRENAAEALAAKLAPTAGLPASLVPLREAFAALRREQAGMPREAKYYAAQVDAFFAGLNLGGPIQDTVHRLSVIGEILGDADTDRAAAQCMTHLRAWTKRWCIKHRGLVRELRAPFATESAVPPAPGLVRFVFLLLSALHDAGLMHIESCTRAVLTATAGWLAAEYAAQRHLPAPAVAADLVFIDRVCGTQLAEPTLTTLYPDDTDALAKAGSVVDTCMQAWGLLFAVPAAGDAQPQQRAGTPAAGLRTASPAPSAPAATTATVAFPDPPSVVVPRFAPIVVPPVPAAALAGSNGPTVATANLSSSGNGGFLSASGRRNSHLPRSPMSPLPAAAAAHPSAAAAAAPATGSLLFGERAAKFFSQGRRLFAASETTP
ncbi:hypothetical protein H9P43_006439 [Blastocladiella emersonii ATCC 22665]|nr:hypothetical protein H9P43_006439 [Blastocladiella emersonii ATCC 22665]